jgi:hypothetical protein
MGPPTGLVISKRTGSTWEREIGALIMANSLKGDTRTRDLLEYTILITKQDTVGKLLQAAR